MGVRILYDESANLAALYCSTSDFAFGPVFHSTRVEDARERAEAFLRWLGEYTPNRSADFNVLGRMQWRHDPRELTDEGLERAYMIWLGWARLIRRTS